MALTIIYEGLGVIANADLMVNDTGGLGTGDWGELGAGSIGTNPDVYLRGAMSIGNQYASKLGYSYFDRVTAMNFSTTYAGQFLYLWINISAKGAFKTGNSFMIRIGGANNTTLRDYLIANKTDANGWSGGWKLFVIDPAKLGSVADTGSYDKNNIRYIGTLIDTDVSVRADSIWFSQFAVGKGLRITGTSSGGWAEAVAYCNDFTNRAWGVLQEREGIYYIYGGIWIGTTATSASVNTAISTASKVLQFGMSEYYYSSAWVTSYPDTANTLVMQDSSVYSTIFTDGVIVGTEAGRSGSVFIGDPNSIISMTLYSGNHASSVTKMYGTTFKDIKGTIVLGVNTANEYFSNTFQGCGVMTLGTSSVKNSLFISQIGLVTAGGGYIKDCGFISATVAVALNWNIASNTSALLAGTLFSSGGTGHAIELGPNCPSAITLTNMTFTGYGAAGSTNAAIYNNSGKAIAITLVGTTEPTVKNGTDASTTFPSSITLMISVKDEAGNPMVGVRCYIDDNNQSAFILDDVTDGSGEASVQHTAGPVANATWRVRKYGYFMFQQIVDIESAAITLPVTLTVDPLQI